NAPCRPRRTRSEGLGKLQQSRRSRSIVVGAAPNLPEGLTVMIVVRAHNDDLVSKRGIRTLDQSENILSWTDFALDIHSERGGHIRLRPSKFSQQLTAGIG